MTTYQIKQGKLIRVRVIWRERLIFLTVGVVLAALYVNHQNQEQLEEVQRLGSQIAQCLPADEGELSLLQLNRKGEMLSLHCTKSPRSKATKVSQLLVDVPVVVD